MSGRRVRDFTAKAQALVDAAAWPDGVRVVVEGQSQGDMIYVFMEGGGARVSWQLDATTLASAEPTTVLTTAVRRLLKQAADPRFTERSRAEDRAMADLLRGLR